MHELIIMIIIIIIIIIAAAGTVAIVGSVALRRVIIYMKVEILCYMMIYLVSPVIILVAKLESFRLFV